MMGLGRKQEKDALQKAYNSTIEILRDWEAAYDKLETEKKALEVRLQAKEQAEGRTDGVKTSSLKKLQEEFSSLKETINMRIVKKGLEELQLAGLVQLQLDGTQAGIDEFVAAQAAASNSVLEKSIPDELGAEAEEPSGSRSTDSVVTSRAIY